MILSTALTPRGRLANSEPLTYCMIHLISARCGFVVIMHEQAGKIGTCQGEVLECSSEAPILGGVSSGGAVGD
jgi:hypothetical protein